MPVHEKVMSDIERNIINLVLQEVIPLDQDEVCGGKAEERKRLVDVVAVSFLPITNDS